MNGARAIDFYFPSSAIVVSERPESLQALPLDRARVVQVIETTLQRRGNGKDDPLRVVTQYWTLDGKLIAERDPAREAAQA
jgi:hypothetical protein